MNKKRLDVKERLQKRKTQKETVIKCSLNKILKKRELLGEIHERILEVSKATNRGSLVFNRLILHCLKNNIPLPDIEDQTLYFQCFNIGLGRLNKFNPLLKEVWNENFMNFPISSRCSGNTQAIVYASKKYMTNFKNSLVYPFDRRQKFYISRWCEKYGIDESQAYPIRCAINGWNCKTEVVFDAINFVEEERDLLGIENKAEMSFEWLKSHPNNVLKYYFHILSCNEEDAKRFHLAPISRIKNHFMTIDTKILYNLMKNCGLYTGDEKEFRTSKEEKFESCFEYKKLCRKKHFSYLLETDGTAVCLHFQSPKPKKSNITFPINPTRIIAIDPGRCNLMFGVEDTPKGRKTYKLTRSMYYNSSGMTNRNVRTAKWEKDIEQEELKFQEKSIKTTSEEDWKIFIKNYISVYDSLWDEKTKKKWSRENFRVYCLRCKTLDKFFHKMVGKEKPVIAFGAAKFNPTGKHELSAPTTSISKRCSKFFKTCMVDEYNTTKICNRCHKQLHIVKSSGTGFEVRGLRWSATEGRLGRATKLPLGTLSVPLPKANLQFHQLSYFSE